MNSKIDNIITILENVTHEIVGYRREIKKLNPDKIYDHWYEIFYMETFANFLLETVDSSQDYLTLDSIEGLAKINYPVSFLYTEYISGDQEISGDFIEISEFVNNLCEEGIIGGI